MPTIVDENITEENQGGGGGGPGGDLHTIVQNKKNITQNYSIDPAYHGFQVGPVTTDLGVTVTVPLGSTLAVFDDPGGGGGSFPNVENYVIVSDIATPEVGKVYNTIADAITYINTLSLSINNRAMIHVYSKEDTSNFTIPLFCWVIGARDNGILSGTISAAGIVALDATLLRFEKFPTLENFIITGTINFTGLSTFLDGNLIIKNCVIPSTGGGIVTGATYQGVCIIFDSQVYKLTYQSSTIFNFVRSFIGGTYSFSSSTTKQVTFESCNMADTDVFPTTSSTMSVDASSGQMQLIFVGCLFKVKPVVTSTGASGYIYTRACLTNFDKYFDLTGYTGNYINESNVYIKSNVNTIATATQVDLALDELYLTKQGAFKSWTPSTAYKFGDIILRDFVFYQCYTDHTSGLTFEADTTDTSKWISLAKGFKSKVITSNSTISWNDRIVLVDASAGDVTLDFDANNKPLLVNDSKRVTIIRIDDSQNIVKMYNNAGSYTVNGELTLPTKYQFLVFKYQAVDAIWTENDIKVIGYNISANYVPAVTLGTNMVSATIKKAVVSTAGASINANAGSIFGTPIEVDLIIDVETTAGATLSDFEIDVPRNSGWDIDNLGGVGVIKGASAVGVVAAVTGALNKVKLIFTSLSAGATDRINLKFSYNAQ